MKKYRKKFILMFISFSLIFITGLATTFAWIGIFTYANTDKFDINLKTVDYKSEYFLTISSTGKRDNYSDEVSIDDIRKQVLVNMGKDVSKLETSEAIEYAYNKETKYLNPVTTYVNDDNSFSNFERLSVESWDGHYDQQLEKYIPGMVSGKNQYLCFDLYLTVDTKEGISSYSEINAPVFLTEFEEAIVGTIGSHMVLDNNFIKFDYSTNPHTEYLPFVPLLKSIPINQRIKVNVANAVRIGFEVFEPIPIDDEYDETNKIAANYIYYGGKLTPSINNDVYDLGGILPTEFNTAVQELMNIRSYLHVEVPNSALSRKDKELNYENSQIWEIATDLSSPNNYLGVHNGVQTKMRLRTYLWFEGWDADCLLGINEQNVIFNLAFTADHDENE